jgi:hypothetical protein
MALAGYLLTEAWQSKEMKLKTICVAGCFADWSLLNKRSSDFRFRYLWASPTPPSGAVSANSNGRMWILVMDLPGGCGIFEKNIPIDA